VLQPRYLVPLSIFLLAPWLAHMLEHSLPCFAALHARKKTHTTTPVHMHAKKKHIQQPRRTCMTKKTHDKRWGWRADAGSVGMCVVGGMCRAECGWGVWRAGSRGRG
jgi:hypothetical protein